MAVLESVVHLLSQAGCAYSATKCIQKIFEQQGFKQILEKDSWNLQPSQGYFCVRDDSSLVAFRVGTKAPQDSGFSMASAHTDSPSLRIKSKSKTYQNGVLGYFVETYGGAILSTWLDRPLKISGKVAFLKEGELCTEVVTIAQPIGIIPNLAIHLNRDVNSGFEYNKHRHLFTIFGTNDELSLEKCLADHLGVSIESVLEYDLFLSDAQPPQFVGLDVSLLSAARIDNLTSCAIMMDALLDSTTSEKTQVAFFFDHEEIGSSSYQGGAGNFPQVLLRRIVLALGGQEEDFYKAMAQSFLLSIDGAHAVHPNFAEKHDPYYAPQVNKGLVIKQNASYRYATNALGTALLSQKWKEHHVPFQFIQNRADVPCGSTLGPLLASALGVQTLDCGIPMWAMHSARETCGILDLETAYRACLLLFQ